jgi:hypothetical protein
VPDRRRHRGAHPRDRELFAEAALPALRSATLDYCWLSSRGYSADAALALVGDRYQLLARQRMAVARISCSNAALVARRSRRLAPEQLRGAALRVDGFNVCITLEAALSGGLVLVGRDGAHRDLASVHGNYRRVSETPPALQLLVSELLELQPARVTWYFDRPVSNSGTLASLLRRSLAARGSDWEVLLSDRVDAEVSAAGGVALSADSGVIDAAERWFDLAGATIHRRVPEAWRIQIWTG